MVLESGLVSYWTMDDGTGSVAEDSKNVQDAVGTGIDSTNWVQGILGSAVDLDGSTEYFHVNNDSAYNLTTGVSIQCWVKTGSSTNNSFLVTKEGASNQPAYVVQVHTDNKIRFFGYDSAGNAHGIIRNEDVAINDNQWHHVLCTFDGTEWVVWVDNGSTSTTDSATLDTDNLGISFGERGSAGRFAGKIDEIAIWDRALDKQDAGSLWNNGSGLAYPFEAGPTTYSQSVDETINLTDEFNRGPINFSETINEEINLTDSEEVDRVERTYTQTINEEINLTDSEEVTRIGDVVDKSISETANLVDTVEVVRAPKTFTKQIDDSISLEDSTEQSKVGRTLTIEINENLSLADSTEEELIKRVINKTINETLNLTDTEVVDRVERTYTQTINETISLEEEFNRGPVRLTKDINETLNLTDSVSAATPAEAQLQTKLNIAGIDYRDVRNINVERTIGEYNGTSSFRASFDSPFGKWKDTFNLNDEVIVFSDQSGNPTTKIFTGIIEDIKFSGSGNKEKLELIGRDYGAILQDIIVNPRIFRDTEASEIVEALMAQNVGDKITTNNVNSSSVTLGKATFNNISMFDAIKRLAEQANFIFYVDDDKDLHFEQRNSTSSGYTFDNSNVMSADFNTTDKEIFNKVRVYGDKQLTGNEEFKTLSTGSSFTLEYKPRNVVVSYSGGEIIQPGGVLNLDDPSNEDVKYLVDFQGRKVILTSGTTAGDNIGTGSDYLIEYQKETSIISLQQDFTSQQRYGIKDKVIVDTNIKSFEEANERANNILSENKDEKTSGRCDLKGVFSITPGQTATVNLPNFGQINQTYSILNVSYDFNKFNNLSKRVMSVRFNKKEQDFTDTLKEQMIKIKQLEAGQLDANIVNLETAIGSVGVSGTATIVSRDIGSAFYFHVPNHNILNGPTSLLGDMRAGSQVITI